MKKLPVVTFCPPQHGVDMVRSCGGVEALYELEESPVDSIRQGASSTVERFFEVCSTS